jgi:hypothetical protein
MVQMTHAYSYNRMEEVQRVVDLWRYGSVLSSSEQLQLFTFIRNVTEDSWRKHFSTLDSRPYEGVKDGLQLAFMDYLLNRKSLRSYAANKALCCLLTPQVYHTVAYTLIEFKRQFPRVVSVLMANDVGYHLLKDYEPRNIRYQVAMSSHYELHTLLTVIRRHPDVLEESELVTLVGAKMKSFGPRVRKRVTMLLPIAQDIVYHHTQSNRRQYDEYTT